MGLCMCTFITCPIGSCVGWGLAEACACGCRKDAANKVLLGVFSATFVAGCICYIALTIGCAKADGEHWTLIRNEGECWSEGGSAPYVNLGLFTGALMGVGFVGAIVMLCRIHHAGKQEVSTEVGSYGQVEDVV